MLAEVHYVSRGDVIRHVPVEASTQQSRVNDIFAAQQFIRVVNPTRISKEQRLILCDFNQVQVK